MKKYLLVVFLLIALPTYATIRPIASMAVGVDHADFSQTQTLTLISPFQNTYKSTSSDEKTVGELFLGIEAGLAFNLLGQIGISYNQTSAFTAKGDVYQFASPLFDNLYYHFYIQSRRVLIQTKLLSTFKQIIHPYVSVGAGVAINQSYGYQEQALSSDNVPMQVSFAKHRDSSFSSALGIGMDIDISPHLRVGGGYQFATIGKAGLGTIPSQDSTQTLSYSHIKVNEFLLQLSYLY